MRASQARLACSQASSSSFCTPSIASVCSFPNLGKGVEESLDFDRLRGGEAVTFEIEQSQKGPRANRVRAA